MPKTKLAISLDAGLVRDLDSLVKRRRFPSRSAAIEAALRNQAKAKRDSDYESMLSQLDPNEERAWANEHFHGEVFE